MIADHLRAVRVFAIADGVMPSNTDRVDMCCDDLIREALYNLRYVLGVEECIISIAF